MSQRAVYRHKDLSRVLEPRSIAIVGASPNAASFGSITHANLENYKGRIYLVNAKYDRIGQQLCYPTVAALPEAPDCVVIAIGQERVEAAVRDCIERQAGGAVIYAAGFSETGREQDIQLQERIAAMAREANFRMIGPNVVGLYNHVVKAALTFTPDIAFSEPGEHAVGLISQSGGLANGLTQALRVGISLSHSLSAGNSCDVDCADYVDYLAEDPNCSAIAMVFEGLPSTDRLLEAGEIARRASKPLIVFKLGRGQIGAAAAKSHTGFLSGTDAAYAAAFRRMGAIVVKDYHALMETASFFAKAPAARAQGVAICSTSGGTVVHAADEAEEVGVILPQPSAALKGKIAEHVPSFASIANPCDITAAAGTNERLVSVADLFLSSDSYAALVNPHLYATDLSTPRLIGMGDLALKHGKMVAVTLANEWMGGPGVREMNAHAGLGLFRSTRDCFVALKAWIERGRPAVSDETSIKRCSPLRAREHAAKILASHATTVVSEAKAKQILAAYGIPVVTEAVVTTEAEALEVAKSMGGKVALKVLSDEIPHKTDVGVVRLGLQTPEQVQTAYREIMDAARALEPAPTIEGVVVQPMLDGLEIVMGTRLDPQFGPLILVGMGGVLVEVLRDTNVALAPLTRAEAHWMIQNLKGARLLQGYRGRPAVDVDKLAEILLRVSEFALDHKASVSELDINPLICSGSNLMAVDALIIKGAPGFA